MAADGVDGQRWARVKAIFADALDRDPSEWPTLLDTTCEGDDTLRTEVEALLEAHTASGEFLEEPVLERTDASVFDALDAPAARERVGPYRIERELGRGGMGVVYLASRDDASFHKRVALKVTKRGMDTDEVLRRFKAERQILASLDHPNIASLLDGGTTEDDLPYFVLEYVEGMSIDEFCDSHRLGVRGRLQLYLKVLDAVQFAHRNLVVHRDLKPSNIVVTDEGVPKLLDFGIAKLLDDPGDLGVSPSLAVATVAGVWLMTPEYASPEQVRGEPITTASDVYSLGVLLYELLTGHRPYRLNSRNPDEVVRVVCEAQPPKPSSVVTQPREALKPGDDAVEAETLAALRGQSPRKLQRRLTGDLDVIITKAMRKEPGRRYGSVHELATDLHRHLRGLPVRAQPDSFAYRFTKWIRRNKAVAAFMVLTSFFAVVTTVQRIQVEKQRDSAETSARLFEGVFQGVDPRKGGNPNLLARELLENKAEQLLPQIRDAQPEGAARFMDTMGRAYTYLGLNSEAEVLLEEALALRQEHLGQTHVDVADSLANLAGLRFNQGRYPEANELLEEAIDIVRGRLDEDHPHLEIAVVNLALVLYRQGEFERAEALLQDVLDERDMENLDVPAIFGLFALGQLDLDRGESAAAEEKMHRAFDAALATYGEDHLETARFAGALAVALRRLGRLDEAEVLQSRALQVRIESLGREHEDVAASLHNLAAVRADRGRLDEAVELFHQAIEIRRRLLGDDSPQLASSLEGLGSTLTRLKRFEEAEASLVEALRTWQRAYPDGHPEITGVRARLGRLMMNDGRYSEAIEHLEVALSDLAAADSPVDRQEARVRIVLAVCLIQLDRGAEAWPMLKAGHAALNKLQPDHPDVAFAEGYLALCPDKTNGG